VRIQVNGTTLNVLQQSALRNQQSAILVFLHYFGGSSRAWTGVIDQLADEHRWVAPDLRGFGNSDAPNAGYTTSEMADDVIALIASLNLERYVLVGHSMGGKIALAVAARRPAGLRSLVLLAPSPPTPEPVDDSERTRLLKSYGDRIAAAETVSKIVAQPLPLQEYEQVIADNLRTSHTAWRAWLEHGSREDISMLMPQINVPVLVAVGAADQVLPAALLEREVVGRITGARLAIVPGRVGHLLPLEAPGATAELIRGSLSSN
jgi:pimeloyl-ACP methyl ester carboxylesterase